MGVQVLILAPQIVQDVSVRRPKRVHVGFLGAGAGQLHVPAHAEGLHLRTKPALSCKGCDTAHTGSPAAHIHSAYWVAALQQQMMRNGESSSDNAAR